MRHLELHMLQSVPVSCLNRDELGSPKTAFFGGAQRARVSSQCWKRAVREYARELCPQGFGGERTKLVVEPLRRELEALGLDADKAGEGAKALAAALGKWDADAEKKGKLQIKTLFFTSPNELRALATAYAAAGEAKDAAKKALKSLKPEDLRDAADISLFGRMVADDHSLTLEGAAMFSHALSTHRVDNEMDFYSAVDDKQPEDESGAGMMGTLEFQSATYYRFVALNLDLLADADHLGSMSAQQRQEVVKTFVEACLKALPGARRNSMNAATLPGYVLAVIREQGHPVQLINAFEAPVEGRSGLLEASIKALEAEHARLQKVWGLQAAAEYRLPEQDFATLLAGTTSHVR